MRNYRKEAQAEIFSLLLDGWGLVSAPSYYKEAEFNVYMRHLRTGKRLSIHVRRNGWRMFINNELVKSEPI